LWCEPIDQFWTTQDSFGPYFTPGTHYELLKPDLSDMASKTLSLLHEAARDPARLNMIAAVAMQTAHKVFSETFVTDSLAWSIMQVKVRDVPCNITNKEEVFVSAILADVPGRCQVK
jgi:hypothetical protein